MCKEYYLAAAAEELISLGTFWVDSVPVCSNRLYCVGKLELLLARLVFSLKFV